MVALDWGFAATAIALGLTPVGVAETALYRDWVRAPGLPEGVAEVGLRTEPSFDALAALRPDLILTNALHVGLLPRLRDIAPTLDNPTFAANRAPLENAKCAAQALGARLSRTLQAEALIRRTEQTMADARDRLRAMSGEAFLPMSVIDRRHLMVYGEGALFVDALRAIGLTGLFPGATSLWGQKMLAVADLAALPPGGLLIIGPTPAAAAEMFDPSGLFAKLCAAGRRSVHRLPAAWGFGDLTAAARFAALAADALTAEPPA